MPQGKLIVLYGINNLGKTTQAKLLTEAIKRAGRKAEYLKCPIYDLEPTGPMIDRYLRQGNPDRLSARELQMLYALNRYNFEPQLRPKLESCINIVSEDYWGTGVAWGMAQGVDKQFLLGINAAVLREDLAFLFDGERFASGIEKNHANEADNALTARSRQAHLELGQEFGWIPVNANQPMEVIHEFIWEKIKTLIVAP